MERDEEELNETWSRMSKEPDGVCTALRKPVEFLV